ncbi:MAG: tetratricopeptide repeat protein [Candidatus Dormibacteraceae bacterium]
MSPQTEEVIKSRSAYAEEAVQLAVDANWEQAVEVNTFILEHFEPEESVHNRLGKALAEVGRLEEATRAYQAALEINPLSPVARKNVQKLENLRQNNQSLGSGIGGRIDLNLFVEEMGKTTTTVLKSMDQDGCGKVVAGDVAELRIEGGGVEIDTLRGVRIGSLESKLARRLIKFMQGGNRYQAGVTACEGNQVKLIIREVYQDAKFAGKPSFPITRKRDVEFRPYSRNSLAARPVESELVAIEGDDEEADDSEVEIESSLHEVDESADLELVSEIEDVDGEDEE